MQRQVTILLLLSHLLTTFHPAYCSTSCTLANPALTTKTKTFQKMALDDVILGQMTLFVVKVTTLLDCGHRCLAVAECVMFSFRVFQNGQSPACQTFAQLPTSSTGRLPAPGTQSYAIRGWQSCSPGYSMLCGRCLRYETKKVSQADAKQHCHQLREGHLVVIGTQQELGCVMDKSGIPVSATAYLWFAADDLAEQGRYVWADGSCLPNNSSLWYSGQPDDNSNDRCVGSRRSDKRLHSHDCSRLFFYACQIDI